MIKPNSRKLLDFSDDIKFTKTANFECLSGKDFIHGHNYTFGYSFEPKGSFTFSWESHRTGDAYDFLCSPILFMIREYVRRTQFNATCIFANDNDDDDEKRLQVAHFPYIVNRDLDLYFDHLPLTDEVIEVTVPSKNAEIEPQMYILSSKYYKDISDDNDLYAFVQNFDSQFIIILVVAMLLIFIILAFIRYNHINKQHCNSNTSFINVFLFEIWFCIWGLFTQNSLKVILNQSYRMIYGPGILMAFIITCAFSTFIIAHTIRKSTFYYETLEQIIKSKTVKPYVAIEAEDLKMIKKVGTLEEKKLIEEAQKNDNLMDGSVMNFILISSEVTDLVRKKKTHVLISSLINVNLLSDYNSKDVAISENNYLSHATGVAFHKDLSKNITEAYNKLYSDVFEGGFLKKTIEAALDFGIDCLHKELSIKVDFSSDNDSEQEKILDMDKFEIALGPLLFGLTISLLIIILEYMTTLFKRATQQQSMEIKQQNIRRLNWQMKAYKYLLNQIKCYSPQNMS